MKDAVKSTKSYDAIMKPHFSICYPPRWGGKPPQPTQPHLSRAHTSLLGTGGPIINKSKRNVHPKYFNKADKTQWCRPLCSHQLGFPNRNPLGGLGWLGGCVQGSKSSRSSLFHLEQSARWMRLGYHGDRGKCSWARRPCLCSITLQKGDLGMLKET